MLVVGRRGGRIFWGVKWGGRWRGEFDEGWGGKWGNVVGMKKDVWGMRVGLGVGMMEMMDEEGVIG